MSRHFDETMTILIWHFLCFGALKILTGDCFIHFSIFSSTFPTVVFPIHFVQGGVQVAYG